MMHLPKEWTLIKMFLKQENNDPDSRDNSVHSLGRCIITFSRSSVVSSSTRPLPSPFFSLNSGKERIHIGIIMNGEWSVLANNSNGDIFIGQVHFIGQGISEGP